MPQKHKSGGFQKIVDQKITEYLRERFGLLRARANTGQVGLAFSEFCVKDVFVPLYDFDLGQLEDGLDCDDKGDIGVDFVYCKEDHYHIFQMKYRRGGGNLAPADIAHFVGTDARVLTRLDSANQEVQNLLADIKDTSAIDYYLVTNGQISAALRREFEQARHECAREPINFHMFDGGELAEKYEEAQSADEQIPGEVTISVRAIAGAFGPAAPCCIDLTDCLAQTGGLHKSIVTVVTGKEIKDLYDPKAGGHERKLFHSNIRNPLGDHNKVNIGLKETLKNKPEDFYLFNNGISALCEKMRIKPLPNGGGVITCEKFQIINGAQTVSTIGKFGDNAVLENVNVLLRITDPGGEEGDMNELRRQIIGNNNSQSVMRHADFRSNDAIQKFIEREFANRGVVYRLPPHKKVVYQRKRGKTKLAKNCLAVTIEDLARAIYAYSEEDKPALLYSQPNVPFSLDRDGGGKYPDLFWDGAGGEIAVWPPERTVKNIAIALLNLYLEKRRKEKNRPFRRGEQGGRDSVKFMSYCMNWQILWGFGHVVRKFYRDEESEIYERLVKNDDCWAETGFVPQWFTSIERIIQEILSDEQRELQNKVGRGATLNFKSWMRNVSKVGIIKDRIDLREKEEFPLPWIPGT